MNTKLKTVLDAMYGSLVYPKSSLEGIGVDKKILDGMIGGSSSYFVSMYDEIPVYIHHTLVKLLTFGTFQVNVAESSKYVVAEYNVSDSDENSAVVIEREETSENITSISTFTTPREATYSLEWLAALFVGLVKTDEATTIAFKDFMEKIKRNVTSDEDLTEEITRLYFHLVEFFVDALFGIEEDVMFVNTGSSVDIRKISKEYVSNTTDFDELRIGLIVQSFYIQEPNPIYFTFVSPKSDVEISTEKAKKLAKDFDFSITGSRKFNETEQEMMANTAIRMVNYLPTQIAIDMVSAFYATNKCSYGSPLRAAMLYGPSGTGKTELVQYLGYKLGLPVTTFSCSANTDEYDLLGKPISLGISNGGDGKIVYTETELTKAIKNGWIIEIQEAAVVKETAVHQIFNSLFDGTELVQLPDGSMITPHPNFIAVFTTNVNYEGCNAMNQSLISRNQFVAEITLPSEEETIERLKKQLNWPTNKNDDAVKTAVTCMKKINEFLEEESIEDGSCDFRAVKDWLQMYLAYNEVGINKSLLELAKYSIVPKSTLDSNYHDDIMAICEGIIPA